MHQNLQIVKDMKLSEAEQELIGQSWTGETAYRQLYTIGALYTSKQFRQMVDDIIRSNEYLATASGLQARSLTHATWALVAATAALVFVGIVQIVWG